MSSLRSVPALRVLAVAGAALVLSSGLAGCASRTPAARGIVEQVAPTDGILATRVVAEPVSGVTAPDPLARQAVRPAVPEAPGEIAAEAARRAWVEENLGRGRVLAREPRTEPSGPLVERERIVVRERPTRVVVRDDRWCDWPPVHVSLGWWGGRHWRRGHRGFGWGLGWSVPFYCW